MKNFKNELKNEEYSLFIESLRKKNASLSLRSSHGVRLRRFEGVVIARPNELGGKRSTAGDALEAVGTYGVAAWCCT